MGIKAGLSLQTCAMVLAKGSAGSYTTKVTLPKFVRRAQNQLHARAYAQGCSFGEGTWCRQRCTDARRKPRTRAHPDGRERTSADADVNCLVHLNEHTAQVEVAPKR